MTLSEQVTKNIIKKLIKGDDYRIEIITLILMGKGNPESADVIFARGSNIFVADKLSDQNKTQFEQNNVQWVELRGHQGFKRFKLVLENLQIPHQRLTNHDFDSQIDDIFNEMLV